jgi:hypothetical protein
LLKQTPRTSSKFEAGSVDTNSTFLPESASRARYRSLANSTLASEEQVSSRWLEEIHDLTLKRACDGSI